MKHLIRTLLIFVLSILYVNNLFGELKIGVKGEVGISPIYSAGVVISGIAGNEYIDFNYAYDGIIGGGGSEQFSSVSSPIFRLSTGKRYKCYEKIDFVPSVGIYHQSFKGELTENAKEYSTFGDNAETTFINAFFSVLTLYDYSDHVKFTGNIGYYLPNDSKTYWCDYGGVRIGSEITSFSGVRITLGIAYFL